MYKVSAQPLHEVKTTANSWQDTCRSQPPSRFGLNGFPLHCQYGCPEQLFLFIVNMDVPSSFSSSLSIWMFRAAFPLHCQYGCSEQLFLFIVNMDVPSSNFEARVHYDKFNCQQRGNNWQSLSQIRRKAKELERSSLTGIFEDQLTQNKESTKIENAIQNRASRIESTTCQKIQVSWSYFRSWMQFNNRNQDKNPMWMEELEKCNWRPRHTSES